MMHEFNKIIIATVLIVVSSTTGFPLRGELTTDQIIAKARDYLGGDTQLRAVETIQFQGTFTTHEGDGKGEILIYLKKPFKQRLDVIRAHDGIVETTAINDIDGWGRRANEKDAEDWTIRILSMGELKRMRANTFDNLNFYSGIEQLGGSIINKGIVNKEGKEAYLLHFKYDKTIHYKRYFDVNTGKLLGTINDKGIEIKDIDEIIVDGIRFPREQIRIEDGKKKDTLTFTKIVINAPLDDKIFELPSLRFGK